MAKDETYGHTPFTVFHVEGYIVGHAWSEEAARWLIQHGLSTAPKGIDGKNLE